MLKITTVGLGLFTLLATALPQEGGHVDPIEPVAPVQPQAPSAPAPDPVSCPFNSTLGPNIMVAVVQLPTNATEINAWIYGYNWCSNSNLVSTGNDICFDSEPDRSLEFMHIPLSNKFGTFHDGCYANVDIRFEDCTYKKSTGKPNWRTTTARITSKDGKSEYKYQCVDDREYHGCVYNGQVNPASEVRYTAFMSCGIMAEP